MAKFIVIKPFKSPYVTNTGAHPKLQNEVKYMQFKRGAIIDGVVKYDTKGNPDFILYKGVIVVPINVVKKLETKEIISNAEGDKSSQDKPKSKIIKESNSKVNYIDNAIIGGVIGALLVVFAEKRGWIVEPVESKIPHQYKLIGVGLGALAGAYYTYRKNVTLGIKIVKEQKTK